MKKEKINLVNYSLKCKDCYSGNLIKTGCAHYTDPLQYEYECDKCGKTIYLTEDEETKTLWL